MGAERSESTGGSYYNVTAGAITRTIQEEDLPENYNRKEYRVREGKNEDGSSWKKCEEIYTSFRGTLKGVYIVEPPFGGKQIRLVFEDAGETSFINVPFVAGNGLNPYGSDLAGRLCALMPTEVFGEEVVVWPYKMKREDKPDKFNTGVSIRFEGAKIKNAFSKDGVLAKNLPQPVKTTALDGSEKWDYSAVNAKVYQIFEKWVDSFGKLATENSMQEAEAQVQEPIAESIPEDMQEITDELPW